MKKRFIILFVIIGLFSMAATPLVSTKVNESFKSMLNQEGKFSKIITANSGCEVTGNLNVTGNLSGATSAIKYGTGTYYTPYVLYLNYANASMTGTTSTQLDSFVLPGGLLGTKDMMEVYVEFEFASTDGQKALNCTSGATDLFSLVNIATATVGYGANSILVNKGSTTANINKKLWRSYGANTNVASIVSTNINTAENNTFSIRANNVSPGTNTITLHCTRVTIFKEQN